MTPRRVIERIRGTRTRTGANRSFALDDQERVRYVERGHLDVFVVARRGDRIIGRRRFVARVRPGEMAFGVAPLEIPGRDGHSLGLMATPSQGAVLIAGDRAGVGSTDFDAATTDWVDRWISQLSAFLARDLPLPRDALRLEADPDIPYKAGSICSAQHLDVVWVSADAPMALIGRDDVIYTEGEPLLPLTEQTWLELAGDGRISAVYTPTALLRELLWPAFDHFGARVLELAHLAERGRAAALRMRRRESFEVREALMARAVDDFREILGDADPDAGQTGQTPLQQAAHLVARATGAILDTSGAAPEGEGAELAIDRIATRSGMRARRVRLRPGWWRRDGPSMVGFGEGERPLALLADGRGRYRVTDPSTGGSSSVNATTARGIASDAFVLYAPLPRRRKRLADMLGFAMHGRAADVRAVVGMGVLAGLAALVAPILTGQILVHIIPRGDTSLWAVTLGALLTVTLGSAVFEVVRGIATIRIESRMDERLQAAIWSHLLSVPALFFRRFTAGDLALRADGVASVRQTLTSAATQAAMGAIFSVFSLALLFYYSGVLALLVTAMLLLLGGANWVFALFQLRHDRVMFRVQGEVGGVMLQVIRSLAKLRVANAESFLLSRWARLYSRQKRESLSARYWSVAQEVLATVFQPLSYIIIFAAVTRSLSAEGTSFDLVAFLSFNAAFGQLSAGIGSMISATTTVVRTIPIIERMRPILDADPESVGGLDPGDLKGDVEFDNVSFRYEPDARNAVSGISFRARQGEYVAFVGPSGCGKSTLYRLLLGFEKPDSGAIFLDGHSLSSLDLVQTRRNLGVVLQNGQVVPGTIFHNIAGMLPLSLDEAWEAARAAALNDDIRAMPMGMNTILTEGGNTLSVGQRQRLLIARAVARKPRILLLDEATSALDNVAQAKVQRSLKKLGMTRLVIAHRLTSIQDAERIHVLDQGRIVESGTYRHLMQADGLFADLARRQLLE